MSKVHAASSSSKSQGFCFYSWQNTIWTGYFTAIKSKNTSHYLTFSEYLFKLNHTSENVTITIINVGDSNFLWKLQTLAENLTDRTQNNIEPCLESRVTFDLLGPMWWSMCQFLFTHFSTHYTLLSVSEESKYNNCVAQFWVFSVSFAYIHFEI